MSTTEQKLVQFRQNARDIAGHDFGGPVNKAMFWGHTQHSLGKQGRQLNHYLCSLYKYHTDTQAYTMDDTKAYPRIHKFIDHYKTQRAPESVIDQAWDMFSEAFARRAQGDHIFVAANDTDPNDFLVRVELPIILENFSRVTALEPTLDNDGEVTFRATEWTMSQWEERQKRQWENPYRYIERGNYPDKLLPPGR